MENKKPFLRSVLIDCRTQISAPALVHRGLVVFLAQDLYRLSVVQARYQASGGTDASVLAALRRCSSFLPGQIGPVRFVRDDSPPPRPLSDSPTSRGPCQPPVLGPSDPQSFSCSLVSRSSPLLCCLFSTLRRGGCM